MLKRPSNTLVVLLTALVLSACVKQGDVKVGMTRLEADLTFGVVPPDTPPPNFGAGFTQAQAEEGPGFSELAPLGSGFINKPRPRIGSQPTTCPSAALNAFPARGEAPINVEQPPAEGSYRWKRGGQTTFDVAPDRPFPNAGLETHLVRNVKTVQDQPPGPQPQGVQAPGGGKEFTFDTLQPGINGGTVAVNSWRVRTAATSVTPRQLSVNGPNQGEPERGLSLEKIEIQDKSGAVLQSYSFPTGVLHFPLPAVPGTQWQSAGVDPTSGVTLSMQGHVIDHERVDACGEIVDGWRVKSTQTFSGTDSRTITYNYIVAPQYGGILVNEQIDTRVTSPVAEHLQIDNSIGQLNPGPLPKEEE